MQTLRPVLCACFRRERKWSAKKPSPCFRPFILQKKKRLKALLEWLHWLPWLPWASICKTEEKTLPPPLSLAIPESDIRAVLRERLHILALFIYFFLPCHSQFTHAHYHNINFRRGGEPSAPLGQCSSPGAERAEGGQGWKSLAPALPFSLGWGHLPRECVQPEPLHVPQHLSVAPPRLATPAPSHPPALSPTSPISLLEKSMHLFPIRNHTT